jgi:uncharacterized protein YfiM (DUF2279 family)
VSDQEENLLRLSPARSDRSVICRTGLLQRGGSLEIVGEVRPVLSNELHSLTFLSTRDRLPRAGGVCARADQEGVPIAHRRMFPTMDMLSSEDPRELRAVRAAIDSEPVSSDPAASDAFRRRSFWLSRQDETGWLAPDKKLHVLASYGVFLTFRLMENDTPGAIASAGAVGVVKELHDSFLRPTGPNQGASWHDLVADAVGIAAGVLAWEVFSP